MARTSKKQWHYCGAAYHVTSRGNNRKNIFYDDEDRTKYLSLLKESIQRFECQIHAYCLMDNHVHLLVQVGSTPISDIMHNINFRYARCFNSKYKKVGHLFQGRYAAQIVSSRDYLIRLIRYIHLNPVKANMTQRPESYQWSSHQCYLNDVKSAWLTKHWALSHFDLDSNIAIALYRAYIQSGVTTDVDHDLIGEIERQNEEGTNTLIRSPEETRQDLRILSANFDSIFLFVCQCFQAKPDQVKSSSSQKSCIQARSAVAWLAKDLRVATVKSVAHFFGKNVSSFGKVKSKFIIKNGELLKKLKQDYLNTLDDQAK